MGPRLISRGGGRTCKFSLSQGLRWVQRARRGTMQPAVGYGRAVDRKTYENLGKKPLRERAQAPPSPPPRSPCGYQRAALEWPHRVYVYQNCAAKVRPGVSHPQWEVDGGVTWQLTPLLWRWRLHPEIRVPRRSSPPPSAAPSSRRASGPPCASVSAPCSAGSQCCWSSCPSLHRAAAKAELLMASSRSTT